MAKPRTAKGRTRKPAARKAAPAEKPSEERIRELAYQKWEEAGRPPGDGVEFWLAAEQEIVGQNLRLVA